MWVVGFTESELEEAVDIQMVFGIEMEVVDIEQRQHMGIDNMAYESWVLETEDGHFSLQHLFLLLSSY